MFTNIEEINVIDYFVQLSVQFSKGIRKGEKCVCWLKIIQMQDRT